MAASNPGTTKYPAILDDFANPGTATYEDTTGYEHDLVESQQHDAIEALEATVGTTAGTGVLTNFSAGDLAARVNSETLGTPTIGTADIIGGAIGTADITGGSVTTATMVANHYTWGTVADAATMTFDLDTASLFLGTLGDNRTLAVSNANVGQCFIIKVVQDGTGSRTVTWWETIDWQVSGTSEPTLTTTADEADTFGFVCTSANNYDGFVVGQSS